MEQKMIEVIEYITQLKISNIIKENRDLDKKEIVKKIEDILEEKERLYTLDEKKVEQILKNKIENGEAKNE